MSGVVVVWDRNFDDDLLHWRGSYNPIGDVFRRSANGMATRARRRARQEAAGYTAAANAALARRWKPGGREAYERNRLLARNLSMFAKLVYAIEIRGARENTARVSSGHAAADQVESGGVDKIYRVQIGSRGDRRTAPLTYRAHNILAGVVNESG